MARKKARNTETTGCKIAKMPSYCDITWKRSYLVRAISLNEPFRSAYGNNPAKMNQILEKGKLNINAVDNYGRTALHYAAYKGNRDVVKVLLLPGRLVETNTTIRDHHGRTALFKAVEANQRLCARELLLKADVNTQDKFGVGILHYCTVSDNSEMLDLIMKYVPHLELKDKDGRTPLHVAAIFGSELCCLRLLSAGADIDSRDTYNRTPLFAASAAGHDRIVKLLLERGADLNVLDEFGHDALHYTKPSTCKRIKALFLHAHDVVGGIKEDVLRMKPGSKSAEAEIGMVNCIGQDEEIVIRQRQMKARASLTETSNIDHQFPDVITRSRKRAVEDDDLVLDSFSSTSCDSLSDIPPLPNDSIEKTNNALTEEEANSVENKQDIKNRAKSNILNRIEHNTKKCVGLKTTQLTEPLNFKISASLSTPITRTGGVNTMEEQNTASVDLPKRPLFIPCREDTECSSFEKDRGSLCEDDQERSPCQLSLEDVLIEHSSSNAQIKLSELTGRMDCVKKKNENLVLRVVQSEKESKSSKKSRLEKTNSEYQDFMETDNTCWDEARQSLDANKALEKKGNTKKEHIEPLMGGLDGVSNRATNSVFSIGTQNSSDVLKIGRLESEIMSRSPQCSSEDLHPKTSKIQGIFYEREAEIEMIENNRITQSNVNYVTIERSTVSGDSSSTSHFQKLSAQDVTDFYEGDVDQLPQQLEMERQENEVVEAASKHSQGVIRGKGLDEARVSSEILIESQRRKITQLKAYGKKKSNEKENVIVRLQEENERQTRRRDDRVYKNGAGDNCYSSLDVERLKAELLNTNRELHRVREDAETRAITFKLEKNEASQTLQKQCQDLELLRAKVENLETCKTVLGSQVHAAELAAANQRRVNNDLNAKYQKALSDVEDLEEKLCILKHQKESFSEGQDGPILTIDETPDQLCDGNQKLLKNLQQRGDVKVSQSTSLEEYYCEIEIMKSERSRIEHYLDENVLSALKVGLTENENNFEGKINKTVYLFLKLKGKLVKRNKDCRVLLSELAALKEKLAEFDSYSAAETTNGSSVDETVISSNSSNKLPFNTDDLPKEVDKLRAEKEEALLNCKEKDKIIDKYKVEVFELQNRMRQQSEQNIYSFVQKSGVEDTVVEKSFVQIHINENEQEIIREHVQSKSDISQSNCKVTKLRSEKEVLSSDMSQLPQTYETQHPDLDEPGSPTEARKVELWEGKQRIQEMSAGMLLPVKKSKESKLQDTDNEENEEQKLYNKDNFGEMQAQKHELLGKIPEEGNQKKTVCEKCGYATEQKKYAVPANFIEIRLREENEVLRDRVGKFENQLRKIEKGNTIRECQEKDYIINRQEEQVNILTLREKRLLKEMKDEQNLVRKLEEKVNDLEEKNDELNDELSLLKKYRDFAEESNGLEDCKCSNEGLKARVKDLEIELKTVKESNESSKQESVEKEMQIRSTESSVNDLKVELEALRAKYDKQRIYLSNVKKENRNLSNAKKKSHSDSKCLENARGEPEVGAGNSQVNLPTDEVELLGLSARVVHDHNMKSKEKLEAKGEIIADGRIRIEKPETQQREFKKLNIHLSQRLGSDLKTSTSGREGELSDRRKLLRKETNFSSANKKRSKNDSAYCSHSGIDRTIHDNQPGVSEPQNV